MTLRFAAILLLCLMAPAALTWGAHRPEHVESHTGTRPFDPLENLRLFKDAVERGELVVFQQRIAYSMITPKLVEYVYDLEQRVGEIRVFSLLVEPMAIPNMPGTKIHGLHSILSVDGRILETTAHLEFD